jgi:tRNA(Ile)-lysidine synthase
MDAPLAPRFLAHAQGERLFPGPGAAVLAVSGGPDSLVLLDLLHAAAPALGLTLVVAHVDHGIQADSRTVGQTVRTIAAGYGLPFEMGELRLGAGATETVARRARYAWLRALQARRGARYLVTAHHQDDQVETVLLRVLRGSAPAGLAGMSARARGGLVRPLLAFTRAEIAAHARARGLAAHDDPANRDPAHLRSWVRASLLPLLESRLGGAARVRSDLLRLGRHAAAERRAWDGVVQVVPDLALQITARGFSVARGGLARYDDDVAVALLRAAARRAGLVLGPRRARALLALAAPPRPSGRRLVWKRGESGAWCAEVAFERLVVRREPGDADGRNATEIVAAAPRGSAVFGEFRVEWRPEPAPERLERAAWTTWVAAGEGDWLLRAPRRGDRMAPLGGVGRRPVRRLLMEARVPRGERGHYPVVASGETILWVPGICRSAAALPRAGTPAVRLDVIRQDGAAEADR